MSSIREQNKIKKRRCILDAAIKLFSENGFQQTSIEELAREAGVGKGTVYSYFHTKRDIVRAFCDDLLEYTRSELAAKTNPDTPLKQQLMIIFMADFKYVSENKEFSRVFLQEKVFPKEGFSAEDFEVQNNYFEMLYPIYQHAQEHGELRKGLELLHISGHFYALYLLLVSCWYTGMIPTENIPEAMETMITQTLEGLAP
jgi:AcrR family transcriptional regulator